MEILNKNNLCTSEEYINFTDDNMRMDYLKKVYNGEEPKVVAYIERSTNNKIFATIKYMVFSKENLIVEPRFFKNMTGDSLVLSTPSVRVSSQQYMKQCNIEEYSHILVTIKPNDKIFFKQKTFFTNAGQPEKIKLDSLIRYDIIDEDLIYFFQNNNGTYTKTAMKEYMQKLLRQEGEKYKSERQALETQHDQWKKELEHLKKQKEKYEFDTKLEEQRCIKAREEAERLVEEERKKLEKDISTEKNRLSFYASIADSLYSESRTTKEKDTVFAKCIDSDTVDGYIGRMKDILAKCYNYYCDYEVLFSLYIALQSNQLILLVGNPGCGKSSLARFLPKIFGFQDTVFVTVQSNWSSNHDLLGYYNPMEKEYMPEIFLSELVRTINMAKIHPEELFFVCLEEMNLARIEYYFADFLSVLQGDRVLKLYAKDICDTIDNAIADNPDADDKKIKRIKYPYEIVIPENIKFIGTLNQDETTLDLSPKVLNRSYVVKMENNRGIYQSDDSSSASNELYTLRYKAISDFYGRKNTTIGGNNSILLSLLKPQMSYRLQKEFLKPEMTNKWNSLELLNKYLDHVVASTILPSISVSGEKKYNETESRIDSIIKCIFQEPSVTESIFQEMNDPDEEEIYYWRK